MYVSKFADVMKMGGRASCEEDLVTLQWDKQIN